MACQYKFEDSQGETHLCQFNSEKSHICNNGEEWCMYHLPFDCGKSSWGTKEIEFFNGALMTLIKLINGSEDNLKLNLTGVIFPIDIKLEEMKFSDVSFLDAKFYGELHINRSTFNGEACVNSAVFFNKLYCIGSDFSKGSFIEFEGSAFKDEAFFCMSKFGPYNSFKGSVFEGDADFDDSIFGSYLDFSSSKFLCNARFKNSIFGSDIIFDSSEFNGDCNFNEGRRITKEEEIGNDCFNGVVSFKNCSFRGRDSEVVFNNRSFKEVTFFNDCVFQSPPQFYNSNLHQYTNFKNSKFLNIRSSDSDMAYRTLKLAMENNRSRNEQAIFYSLEQRSLIHQKKTPIFVKLFSIIYYALSNYGQSITRPMVSMLMILIVFYLMYFVLHEKNETREKNEYYNIVVFTVSHSVRPFHSWTLMGRNDIGAMFDKKNFNLIIFLSLIQTIISLTIFALFLLSIRWRFKRD